MTQLELVQRQRVIIRGDKIPYDIRALLELVSRCAISDAQALLDLRQDRGEERSHPGQRRRAPSESLPPLRVRPPQRRSDRLRCRGPWVFPDELITREFAVYGP